MKLIVIIVVIMIAFYAGIICNDYWRDRERMGRLINRVCSECDAPTGRCEDDFLFIDDGPLCEECYDTLMENK